MKQFLVILTLACSALLAAQSENYQVSELPKNKRLALPNKTGSLNYSVNVVGNTINIIFSLKFNKAIYLPNYYPYLKELMNQVVDIQTNSLIVLKKK